MPQIKVPAALAGGPGAATVTVEGNTVREVLDNHAGEYGPDLRDSVVADDDIKEFINVFVDGTAVDDLDAPVEQDALLRIIPAASGGR